VPGRAAASTCTERRAGRREEEVARGEGATRGRKKRTIVFPSNQWQWWVILLTPPNVVLWGTPLGTPRKPWSWDLLPLFFSRSTVELLELSAFG
jgi:hypothetical protein